jgi:hypothetical protein
MTGQEWLLRSGAVAGVALLIGLGHLARAAAAPHLRSPEGHGETGQEKLEENATASLFGEMRGGIADYLWMKADRVLHSGVEMRAMTEKEWRIPNRHQAGHAPGEDANDPQGHAHGETTVVPNREADRRGILGEMERQVKPYMDMRSHRHRDTADIMSLFRLMTWANPRFVPGYVVGANILAGRFHKPGEAIAFLKEGEKHNPESVDIQVEIGRYLLYRFKDGAAAEKRFRHAIQMGARHETLPDEEAEAWENAHRWLFIRLHRANRLPEARALARLAVQRFPESGFFEKALQREDLAEERAAPAGEKDGYLTERRN